MIDEENDRGLPSALREPLSRNAPLLLHSGVPARMAWNGAGRPLVAPLWLHWTGTIDTEDFPLWNAPYRREPASAG